MTPEQFDVCARKQAGDAVRAAGLVLVFGCRPCDAAREVGAAEQSVRNAIVRIRARDREIRAAYLA